MPVCPAALVCACARTGCRRPRYYPSDTSDVEWALIAPLLPVPAWQAGTGGRPEANCRRAVVDAIRYVVHNGCVWRAVPADFPHGAPSTASISGGTPAGRPGRCTTGYARRPALLQAALPSPRLR